MSGGFVFALVRQVTCRIFHRKCHDHHSSKMLSHVKISQAHSLAVSYGTCHGQLSDEEREHFRRLWWTIYIICVKACDAGGICPSLTEGEIAIGLPENDDGGINSCIRLHAKVCTLTARLSKCKCSTARYEWTLTRAKLHTESTAITFQDSNKSSHL